jgi:hypothetical protein
VQDLLCLKGISTPRSVHKIAHLENNQKAITLKLAFLAEMEARARNIFRNALGAHYIDGIGTEAAVHVEKWLMKHKGWFPDPQVLYGDGTPLTQPHDEGSDAMSPFPDAVEDAIRVMSFLRDTWPLMEEESDQKIFSSMQQWLDEAFIAGDF